jgi:2-methylisocitrate lyase-like PEP mutase family enzyme
MHPTGTHALDAPGRSDHRIRRAHAKLLIEVGGLPVNADFEDGYGQTPDDVVATVQVAIEAGLAGIGIQDTSGDPAKPIRDFDEAVARGAAALRAVPARPRGSQGDRESCCAQTGNLVVGIKSETLTLAELSAAGVKRISVESSAYTHVAAYLQDAATALAPGDIAAATSGMQSSEVNSLLDQIPRD